VLIAVCLGRIGRREEAAQILGAESAWRALANGSFADLPQLVEERFPSTPPP
jgi:hypothetical protein